MKNIYIFYGNNYKKAYKNRKEIIKKYDEEELSTSTFDMNKVPLIDAINDCGVYPFLSEYRVVVITNINFLTPKAKAGEEVAKEEDDDVSDLVRYASNQVDSTILILEVPYDSIDLKNKDLKALFENSNVIECSYPKESELPSIVDEEIIKHNMSIDNISRNELVKRLNENIESYELELEKLFNYKVDDKVITMEDIKKIISFTPNAMIYDLTSAIINKDKNEAFRIYNVLIENGYVPLQILSYLINKFKEFIIVKELIKGGAQKLEIANYLNISSGRAYHLYNDVSNMKYAYLSTILERLKEVDYNLKVEYSSSDTNLPLDLFFLNL